MPEENLGYEFDTVKNEADGYFASSKKSPSNTVEGHIYMKALYHALPMDYITISKLQSKLGREANQTTARKLMDKMTKEGYIEATNNRRLGKRVIHSDLTKRKLAEVQKALDMDAMMDEGETLNKSNNSENQIVHSIGSDLTRTKDRSDLHQNVSNSCDPTVSKLRENEHSTPTSKNQPIASIESHAAGSEKGRKGNVNQDNTMDSVVCSGHSSLSKRSRKSSMVKEPILQYMKRQKSQ
ncbi:DNA-binding HORMA family protein [Artemisia annua]|uniref:DNA-binding HORMA family protein n=1 Tax=Artemisia annua TaxID=35608 RepID=A0A2U1P6Z1_ARTAN|nr:DNA-binding HORMA family protein [Artemisia annua]